MRVSIQQSYEELRPLPEAKEFSPVLMGLVRRTALVASVVFVNVTAGLTLGLANVGITIWAGAMGGGVLGLIGGLAMAILMRLPTHIERYRLDTLKQIGGITTNKEALEALQNLSEFFYYPFSGFRQYFDLHTLYSYLVVIGDHIDPTRPDAKEVWKAFLRHLDKSQLQLPDGEIHLFDSSGLLSRMEGKRPTISLSWISSRWPNKRDLSEVAALGGEVYGKRKVYSAQKRQHLMTTHTPSGLCLAKDQADGKILGYSWYYTQNGIVKIAELAKRPESARLGIGFSLLAMIIKKYEGKSTPIELEIDKAHPFAGKLVQKAPFKIKKELEGERVLLEVDWERYANRL